jgi:hypothetical protein
MPFLNPEATIAFEDAQDILQRLQDPNAKQAPRQRLVTV